MSCTGTVFPELWTREKAEPFSFNALRAKCDFRAFGEVGLRRALNGRRMGPWERNAKNGRSGRVWEPQARIWDCLGAPNGSPKLEFEIEKALNGRWERNAISAIWGAPR